MMLGQCIEETCVLVLKRKLFCGFTNLFKVEHDSVYFLLIANPFMDGVNTVHVGVDSDAIHLNSF
jgi:hypothetical protein